MRELAMNRVRLANPAGNPRAALAALPDDCVISFADEPPAPPARKRRPKLSPLVVAARRLARLLDCGVRTLRTWDSAGKLPAPLRIGGRVVWRVAEIDDWLAAGAPTREVWEARKAARK